jgi:hypothetical protein
MNLTTNVPSAVYPSNTSRNNFYQYSEALIEKGDHIRLQDLRLGYTIDRSCGNTRRLLTCNCTCTHPTSVFYGEPTMQVSILMPMIIFTSTVILRRLH